MKRPLSFEQLHKILLDERLVNYFELVQNLEQLLESGHISVSLEGETEFYKIESLGIKTANTLDTSLPKSVRDRTLRAAQQTFAQEKRLQEVNTHIEKVEDGYQLILGIPDPGTDLITIQLFLPSEEECQRIQRRFLNDPIFLYKAIVALLQGDKEVLEALLPSEEELF